MSSEITRLNVLSRQILDLLMDGMLRVDHEKPSAYLHGDEIASRLNAPIEQVREELALMETLGYITGSHAYGGDPTQAYKGIDERSADGSRHGMRDPNRPTWYIAETGKRMVLAARASAGA